MASSNWYSTFRTFSQGVERHIPKSGTFNRLYADLCGKAASVKECSGNLAHPRDKLGNLVKGHPIPGAQRTAIGITGNKGALEAPVFESLPGVLEVIPVCHACKLVSREVKTEDSVVRVGGVPVGGRALTVVAGPCAVESMEQMLTVAHAIKAA